MKKGRGQQDKTYRLAIKADLEKITAPVGLFGQFDSITLEAANISTDLEVWGQDLEHLKILHLRTNRTK